MSEPPCANWKNYGCMPSWRPPAIPPRLGHRELPQVRQGELRLRAAWSSRTRAAVLWTRLVPGSWTQGAASSRPGKWRRCGGNWSATSSSPR